MRPPTDKEVASACEAAALKYSAQSVENGSILFSYELQGYVKSQIETHREHMDSILFKIIELLILIKETNR